MSAAESSGLPRSGDPTSRLASRLGRPARWRPGARTLQAGVVTLGGLGLLLALATVIGCLAAGATWQQVVDAYVLTNTVVGIGFLVCGVLLGWNRPGNPIGWLFLVCGLGHLSTAATAPLLYYGVANGWPELVTRGLSTVSTVAWQFGLVGLFGLALLLFPDGHLPSPRWRPIAWLIIASMLTQMTTGAISDGIIVDDDSARSLLSIGFVMPAWLDLVLNALNVAVLVFTLGSLIARYAAGGEKLRRQLLWIILAVIAMTVINSQRWITGDGPILLLLSFILIPIAVTVAVLRYQLLDIRLVVSRTLLYLAVSIVAVAIYVALVATLSLLVPPGADRPVAVAAALVVAVGFNPLRILFQKVIDRAFYGSRDDPVVTASRFGSDFESDDDLGASLERVRSSLRLSSLVLLRASVVVATSRSPAASSSHSLAVVTTSLPLTHGARTIGSLEVGLRRGDAVLHEADRRILSLIATPLALALHSMTLAEQVQASRAAIVGAHEVERQRLHRELHDGIGPLLTGAAFRADAVHNILRDDPATADELLSDVRREIRRALDDVRRVVYGLRPLELEELGLIGALRQRVLVASSSGTAVAFSFDVAADFPELSPAIEMAIYRITSEAVTNVLKHSTAPSCVVRLVAADSATVEVVDSGGSPSARRWTAGVGLKSMAERAEELGGTLVFGPTPGGWRVLASIPR